MFAAGPAAKVVACDDDFRRTIGRLVQHEAGNFRPVLGEAHFVEQVLAQARPLDRFQELFWNDHIGVDIDQRHRRGNSGQCREFLHGQAPSIVSD